MRERESTSVTEEKRKRELKLDLGCTDEGGQGERAVAEAWDWGEYIVFQSRQGKSLGFEVKRGESDHVIH